jgi:hypothetical protein
MPTRTSYKDKALNASTLLAEVNATIAPLAERARSLRLDSADARVDLEASLQTLRPACESVSANQWLTGPPHSIPRVTFPSPRELTRNSQFASAIRLASTQLAAAVVAQDDIITQLVNELLAYKTLLGTIFPPEVRSLTPPAIGLIEAEGEGSDLGPRTRRPSPPGGQSPRIRPESIASITALLSAPSNA